MRALAIQCSILAVIVAFCACDNRNPDNGETLFRGSAHIACDREIVRLIAPQIEWFMHRHPEAHITLDTLTALDAMKKLLVGAVRAAIIARDYLPLEDSLLRAHSLEPYKRFIIATDAIVFAVPIESALDTVDEHVLRKTVQGEPTSLSRFRWVLPAPTSSIAGSLQGAVGVVGIHAQYANDGDSVLALLAARRADIGVALLSQLLQEKNKARVRPLRIIIRDSATGDRFAVMPHVATIVKERYPFRVPIYGYLLETARNLPYGMVASIAQEAVPQRAMLNAGIVPGYAKLQLVEQE